MLVIALLIGGLSQQGAANAVEVPHPVTDWMPPAKAFGIAVDPLGNTYVSIKSLDLVQKYSPSGNLLLSWGGYGDGEGQFKAARDLLLDNDGNLVVADGDRIQKFDPNGQFLLMWGWGVVDGTPELQVCYSGCQRGLKGSGSGQFSAVRSLGIGPDGSIYAGDVSNYRITRFNSNGNLLGEWGAAGVAPGQFSYIGDVASDSQGNVYAIDGEPNNRVQKFSGTGQYLMEWGGFGFGPGQFDDPACLGIDNDDVVYVIDLASRAQMFTTQGVYLNEFGGCCAVPGTFWLPNVMTAWGSGDLYVSDTDLGLQKFSTTRWELFEERFTTASDTSVASGIPVFFDSVSVTVTKNPGDTFYISGTCGPLASWTANDNLFVNGTDMGPGFSGNKGLGYPVGVPVDSILLAVPPLSVDSQIPLGTSTVEFKLADLQREIFGNGPMFLTKVPAGAVLDAPVEPRRPQLRITAASNPTAWGTRINLAGPEGIQGTVEVFDHQGRRVRDLGVVRGDGYWDGRSETGQRAPAGVYFLRARQGNWTGSTRVVILQQ